METGVTISIYPDAGYQYEARASDEELAVVYIEHSPHAGRGSTETRVSFGSREEMIAVGKAMICAAQLDISK